MNFYEDKKQKKKQAFERLSKKHKAEAQSHSEQSKKLADQIPFGQPILVGHHSETRHRNHIKKIHKQMDKSIEHDKTAEYYDNKLKNLESPTGISSDDPEAITKLEEEIKTLQAKREEVKKLPIKERDYSFSDIDMRSVTLQSIGTKIRRLEQRITELKAIRSIDDINEKIGDVTIKTDKEQNRVMILFNGKPEESVRTELKRNGFHWSPTNTAWQRAITPQAILSANKIAKSIQHDIFVKTGDIVAAIETRIKCPRCKENLLDSNSAMNSLSRRKKGVRICHKCGEEEAFIDNGLMEEDERERVWVVTKL